MLSRLPTTAGREFCFYFKQKMTGTTIYQIDERDLNAFVAEAARRAGVNALEKYRQTMVSVSWVAELHSVSRATVINYINDGLIEPEVREVEGGKYRFRADYAILLDFKELKEQLKSRKNASK